MDEIMHRLYNIIYLFIGVAVVAFISAYLFNVFLNISASCQSTRIRSLVFKCMRNYKKIDEYILIITFFIKNY